MKTYRQGDILFKKVAVLPEKRTLKNDNIVAEGEATGHKHMVHGGHLFETDVGMFVESLSDDMTTIVHDEHAEIALPEGFYQVVRQREEVGPTLPPRMVRD